MVYVLLGINLIAMILSCLRFSPGKYDSDYNKLFQKYFPKLEIVEAFLFLCGFVYIICSSFFSINYIDDFDKPIILRILLFLTFIIFYFIIRCCKDEILNAPDEIKKQRFFLIPSIIIFIISSSYLASFVFVSFTNRFLNFKNEEEFIVDIVDRVYRVTGSGKSRTHHYELFIKPELYGLNKLDVSSSFYGEANIGDKLKVYVCKGLYGIKYIKRNMKLLK